MQFITCCWIRQSKSYRSCTCSGDWCTSYPATRTPTSPCPTPRQTLTRRVCCCREPDRWATLKLISRTAQPSFHFAIFFTLPVFQSILPRTARPKQLSTCNCNWNAIKCNQGKGSVPHQKINKEAILNTGLTACSARLDCARNVKFRWTKFRVLFMASARIICNAKITVCMCCCMAIGWASITVFVTYRYQVNKTRLSLFGKLAEGSCSGQPIGGGRGWVCGLNW